MSKQWKNTEIDGQVETINLQEPTLEVKTDLQINFYIKLKINLKIKYLSIIWLRHLAHDPFVVTLLAALVEVVSRVVWIDVCAELICRWMSFEYILNLFDNFLLPYMSIS